MRYYYYTLVLFVFFSCTNNSEKKDRESVISEVHDIIYQIESARTNQVYSSDSTVIATLENYNLDGDLIERKTLDADGSMIDQTIIEYYSFRHPKTSITLSENLDTLFHIEYQYNKDSSIVTMQNFQQGKLSVVYYFYKDKYQKTLQQAGYHDGLLLDTLSNVYDQNLNRIKQTNFTSRTFYEFEYNKDNNLIVKRIFDLNTKEMNGVYYYEYEMDSLNNWITMKELYPNGTERIVTKRELEYFKTKPNTK